MIDDLLAQQLNVGQTADGALTYWKWGDEVIVPAIHNSLYADSLVLSSDPARRQGVL